MRILLFSDIFPLDIYIRFPGILAFSSLVYKESVSSEFALRLRGPKLVLLIFWPVMTSFANFEFWGLKLKINQSMYG